jgi:hypothetical protein
MLRSECDVMKQHIAVLQAENSTPGDKESALEELSEMCECKLEDACGLQQLGGLAAALALLDDQSSAVRLQAANLLTVCAQNNPTV